MSVCACVCVCGVRGVPLRVANRLGSARVVTRRHRRKQDDPTSVNESGNVMEVMPLHPSNAHAPMLVNLG